MTKLLSFRSLQQGMTLIEILVVLAIIGLIAGLVGPQVMNHFAGAKVRTAAIQVKELEQAFEVFKLDVGRFPSSSEGLNALVVKPSGVMGWNGPYLKGGAVPNDPWGHSYHYDNPGQHGEIDIYSYGADNALGGEGENADVGNWR